MWWGQHQSGLAKLFFGAGRGILWFSPLLWLGLALNIQGTFVSLQDAVIGVID